MVTIVHSVTATNANVRTPTMRISSRTSTGITQYARLLEFCHPKINPRNPPERPKCSFSEREGFSPFSGLCYSPQGLWRGQPCRPQPFSIMVLYVVSNLNLP